MMARADYEQHSPDKAAEGGVSSGAGMTVVVADCIEHMRTLPEHSIDAVVCDPPYGIDFMGKAWDRYSAREFEDWCASWATEALRALKPGGHLLAFGGTRTYHRLAAGIEDAGFEIRDCLAWMYGSGFPKSLDVSKAIDKAADCPACMGRGYTRPFIGTGNPQQRSCDRCSGTGKATRDVIGRATSWNRPDSEAGHAARMNTSPGEYDVTAPATPEAERWQGWGTAIKPAFEPVVVARKPLVGTVAANVLLHGTGALNIDGCRIGTDEIVSTKGLGQNSRLNDDGWSGIGKRPDPTISVGRWPANVLLDEEAAALLDGQTGEMRDGVAVNRNRPETGSTYAASSYMIGDSRREDVGDGGSGGASRFFLTARTTSGSGPTRFLYQSKASSAERNAGLDGFAAIIGKRTHDGGPDTRGRPLPVNRNVHPTVKPVELMRWLIRLVTPPGGTVLDPFTGSGTTGIAAHLEGVEFLGIEREAEYAEIARARIEWWRSNTDAGARTDAVLKVDRDPAQLDLLGGEAA